jgi:histidinol-phosphate aminotransferase
VATAWAGADYRTVRGHPLECALPAFAAAIAQAPPRLCWLCLPNNPTGAGAPPAAIAALIRAHPTVLFVLDEAYCDLLPEPQWHPELLHGGNLLVLRSMTKAMGLAGLRVGYALGPTAVMEALRAAKPPWNVNACAQQAGIAALSDRGHYAQTLALLHEEKHTLIEGLTGSGWQVVPSAAAFFLVYAGHAAALTSQLLQHGCLVRDCTSFGLPQYIRVSPREPAQNRQLLAAFARLKPLDAEGECDMLNEGGKEGSIEYSDLLNSSFGQF